MIFVESWTRRWTILSSLLLVNDCGDKLSLESVMPGAYITPCASESIRKFPLLLDQKTTLQIPQGTVAAGSTGTVVWNSGILLKRLVECLLSDNVFLHQHDSVLELGCGGTGLVSAVLAKSGVSTVVATDGNPEMIQQVKRMARLNDLESNASFHTSVYQWGDDFDTTQNFDWIVGADLTYNPASWLALAKSMAELGDRTLYLTLGHGGSVTSEMESFVTAASNQLTLDVALTRHVRTLLFTRCLTREERVFVEENGGVSVVVFRPRRLER